MRILAQPLAHIPLDSLERVADRRRSNADLTLAAQIGPHRLAVPAHMARNRRDRPPLLSQRVNLHALSLCHHQNRAPLPLNCLPTTSREEPRPYVADSRVGNFSDRNWGISLTANCQQRSYTSDKPVADGGGNFGRIAHLGIMDDWVDATLDNDLAGVPTRHWIEFLGTTKEQP